MWEEQEDAGAVGFPGAVTIAESWRSPLQSLAAAGILRCQKAVTKIRVVEIIALGRHRTHIHRKTFHCAQQSQRNLGLN